MLNKAHNDRTHNSLPCDSISTVSHMTDSFTALCKAFSHDCLKTAVVAIFVFIHSICISASPLHKCSILKDSCTLAISHSDHRAALHTAASLQKEAEQAGSDYYLSNSLYFQGISNVILGNAAVGKSQLDKAFRLAENTGNDTLCLAIYNGYGVYEANVHMNYARAQQYFYKSLEYAMRIGDSRRQALVESNLAETASIRGDTTGLKYARSCYNWGTANNNALLTFVGAYHCANLYNIAGNHTLALKYIKDADRICKSENMPEQAAVYNLYGQIYTSMGRGEEALDWLRKAEADASRGQASTLPEIYRNYARTLASLGRTHESDRMIQRGLHVSDSLQILSAVVTLLEQRAQNLERQGNYRDALDVYKIYKQSCDSIYANRQQQSINELMVQYDISKREHQADIDRLLLKDERRKTAILLLILASITAILVILWRNFWNQRRLYRKIVISNRDANKREQELLRRVAELSSPDTAPDTPSPSRPLPNTDYLFDKLSDLMENEKAWRDTSLTRERLADMLGTNRTYLTQVITQHTGKGYYQFINSYRIKEAVKILSNPENSSYPLKALASDLGFKSMTTFYKTFLEIVGITPSKYRDAARNI